MRIELFGTIDELQKYKEADNRAVQENMNKYGREALLIENYLSYFFENKYIENLLSTIKDDLKADLYSSLLYTSEYLKYEKERYNVIRLSEEYYKGGFEDVTSGMKRQWANRFSKYAKKKFISDLMQYDEGTETM